MATVKELRAEREKIDKQIAEQTEIDRPDAIAKILEIVTEFGLTSNDVFGIKSNPKSSDDKKKVVAKYRNDDGKEWSGRGKPPLWIAGKDRNLFLIDKPAIE